MGKDNKPKPRDNTGIPKALKETHWSVVKLLHAISFAIAIIINIATHNHVNLFHPSGVRLTADFIIAASGFLPKIFPEARTPAIIIETIVGFILIKKSSSKKIVKPPKNTTATHPAAAIIGIFLNQYHERASENNVLITKTVVPAIIP